MKPTTTTTTKNVITVISSLALIGLIIFGMWDMTKIVLDGRGMIYNVFYNSLQERIMLFPGEIQNASLKLFLAVIGIVFLLGVNYLARKEKPQGEDETITTETTEKNKGGRRENPDTKKKDIVKGWLKIVESGSNQTQKSYCANNAIDDSTLRRWINDLKKSGEFEEIEMELKAEIKTRS